MLGIVKSIAVIIILTRLITNCSGSFINDIKCDSVNHPDGATDKWTLQKKKQCYRFNNKAPNTCWDFSFKLEKMQFKCQTVGSLNVKNLTVYLGGKQELSTEIESDEDGDKIQQLTISKPVINQTLSCSYDYEKENRTLHACTLRDAGSPERPTFLSATKNTFLNVTNGSVLSCNVNNPRDDSILHICSDNRILNSVNVNYRNVSGLQVNYTLSHHDQFHEVYCRHIYSVSGKEAESQNITLIGISSEAPSCFTENPKVPTDTPYAPSTTQSPKGSSRASSSSTLDPKVPSDAPSSSTKNPKDPDKMADSTDSFPYVAVFGGAGTIALCLAGCLVVIFVHRNRKKRLQNPQCNGAEYAIVVPKSKRWRRDANQQDDYALVVPKSRRMIEDPAYSEPYDHVNQPYMDIGSELYASLSGYSEHYSEATIEQPYHNQSLGSFDATSTYAVPSAAGCSYENPQHYVNAETLSIMIPRGSSREQGSSVIRPRVAPKPKKHGTSSGEQHYVEM